jgi:hypothetical protein
LPQKVKPTRNIRVAANAYAYAQTAPIFRLKVRLPSPHQRLPELLVK